MEKYDLCVIGGGPSGYAAAMRAVDFDKSVLLVERDRIGGAGIYDGALSSKTFWEISKEFASFSKKMRRILSNITLLSFGSSRNDNKKMSSMSLLSLGSTTFSAESSDVDNDRRSSARDGV